MLFRLAFLLLVSISVFAQQSSLTIASIASESFSPRGPQSVKWSPDGAKVSYILRSGDKGELGYMDAATGNKAVLVSESKLTSLSQPANKIADERLREWRTRYGVAAYHWAPDSKSLLFDSNGQFWLYSLDSGTGVQLTASADLSSDPKFSPDGKRLAYVRKHNLWVRDLPDGYERQVTKAEKDEEEDTLNGEVDWLYAEELDVRSNYFWSPDSRQIAYLQTDEKVVPNYPIVDYGETHAKAAMQKYPNPGDPNPTVRVGVLDPGSGRTKWIKIPEKESDYIPRFGWLRPGVLWIFTLNREQDKVTLWLANSSNGDARAVYTETGRPWFSIRLEDFTVLNSGTQFLWTSWRDGHTHIYLYSFAAGDPMNGDAQLVRQVTTGDYEVFSIESVDEKAGQIYFIADPNDPRQRQLFSIKLDGAGRKQVSNGAGTHAATFGPNPAYFVDKYSTLFQSPSLSLCNTAGACKPMFETKPVAGLTPPEWLELTAADGKTKLYGQLFMPPDAPAGAKIPVVLHPYGGPSGQSVRDDWGRQGGLFQFYLAQKGFAVLVVDNRGMANRGRDFNAFLKSKFGPIELADQLAALDQVAKKCPQLDASRVGIYGASYGGYMVLYAMTHSDRFRAGVSIAPVSNWRYYDSAYTERYLGLPSNNEEGYATSSPTNDAAHLSGALRIAHGASDDNVHIQNSIEMTEALIKAGKPFDLMLYPNKTHGITGADATSHLYHSIEDHFTRYLQSNGGPAQ